MKKYLIFKEKSRRFNSIKLEKKKFLLKIFIKNFKLNKNLLKYCFLKLFFFKKNTYFSKLCNSCLYTTNSHFVLRTFKMSRMIFKEYIRKGFLNWIKKSSW